MLESDVKVPAALNLPFGQLFFGFNVPPSTPPAAPSSPSPPDPPQPTSFGGSGRTLRERAGQYQAPSSSGKGKEKEKAPSTEQAATWGVGNVLGSPPGSLGLNSSGLATAGRVRVPRPPQRIPDKPQREFRTPSPDWGVDDEDVEMIDSD